jgi:antitoxin (DNA-binding transcriptional repressor) of toxin-antitoxin stability system
MAEISITKLARNLADIVNRVAYRGESFRVIRGNRAVAELVPSPRGRRLAELPAVLSGLPRLPRDDSHRWIEEIEAARRDLGPMEDGVWPS